MKPATLIVLTIVCITGEVMWFYRSIQVGNELEAIILFFIGILLGFISGQWTSRMFNDHYIDSLLRRINIMKTPIGRRNTLFTFLALGIPMTASFLPQSQNPFLPVIQSYVFGFICGMNVAIYNWARRLPD